MDQHLIRNIGNVIKSTGYGVETIQTKFKKNVFAYVLKDGNLTKEQLNATAQDVYNFLRFGTDNDSTHMYNI